MKKVKIYAVLLAGGFGERLWPLSRSHHPKQFLSLSGKKTMLEDTLDRVEKIDPAIKIWCVSSEKFKQKIKKYAGSRISTTIFEPCARNTAPALATACLKLQEEHPESLVIFLPTDHYIPEAQKFARTVRHALKHAQKENCITLIGLKPTYASTAYGYIQCKPSNLKSYAYPVVNFFEKPSEAKAVAYVARPDMLWNGGMFCGPVQAFIDAFSACAPEILSKAHDFLASKADYESLPSISFDYAVLEKLHNLAVVPANFMWSDVGDLATFLHLKKVKNNAIMALNAQNNLVYSTKKIVALAGVDNLCIVETDDTLLVLPKEKAQDVKHLLALVKNNKKLHKLL